MYTVVIYDLKMCMKEDNSVPNSKSREISSCAGQGVMFNDLTYSSSFLCYKIITNIFTLYTHVEYSPRLDM